MYLLDTNVVSELRKANSGKANAKVIAWAGSVSASSLFLSVITILELETGILLIERRDAARAAYYAAGLKAKFCQPSWAGFFPWMYPLRNAVRSFMC